MDNRQRAKENKYRGILGAMMALLLMIMSVLVFFLVYFHQYTFDTRYAARGNYLLLVLYSVLLLLFLNMYGAFRIRQSRTRELCFSFAIATAMVNVLMYFVLSLVARRMLPIHDILLATLIQWIGALLLYVVARILIPRIEPAIPTLFVYADGESTEELSAKFDTRRTSYVIADAIPEEAPFKSILRSVNDHEAVALGRIDPALRQEIIGYCYRTGRRVLLIPDMTDIIVGSATPLIMGDFLLYDLNTRGRDPIYAAIKRGIDILASGLGMLVLSPLMLLTALAIKLQDGGPVIFSQTRLTKDGREFKLNKFRSMIVNAESETGAVLSAKDDSRITPVGRVMRATRLDELPQLWNIFVGDMTLVGPRPERPEFYETIEKEYPEFSYRLTVKAGLTGYAQLYGKYNTTFEDKARLDMYYIQHASLLWDIQMILYTLKIIFIRESTEGVEDERAGKKQENTTVQ